MIVAIDGPSGEGKSTLAKRIAREFGLTYLDTGAMYRALALKVLRHGLDLTDDESLTRTVGSTEIDLRERAGKLEVLLDGEEVSDLIRTPEVSQMASRVSALPVVRQRMLELQRALGQRGSVVAEGRDIGTVVFPQAEETLREMEQRDKRDSERDLAPLRRAEDALAFDSSGLSAEAVAARAIEVIRNRDLQNKRSEFGFHGSK